MVRFILFLVLCLAAGCGQGANLVITGTELDLIEKIQNAPNLVKHSGVRRFESYYKLDGFADTLIYREEFFGNGEGRFEIKPLGAVEGGLASDVEFIALQRTRAGFNHRYRDFLVRDLLTFIDNYYLTADAVWTKVVGRDCVILEVSRRDHSSRYTVYADAETGLVLRYAHYGADGTLYSMMEYESFDANPDLSGVNFHNASNGEIPLTDLDQLSFKPLIPKQLHKSGFRFMEASVVINPVTLAPAAKFTYTDGVETMFFVDEGIQKALSPVPGAPLATGGTSGLAGLTTGAQLEDGENTLRFFHTGPLTAMWGQLDGHEIFLVGKAPKAVLQRVLESALN